MYVEQSFDNNSHKGVCIFVEHYCLVVRRLANSLYRAKILMMASFLQFRVLIVCWFICFCFNQSHSQRDLYMRIESGFLLSQLLVQLSLAATEAIGPLNAMNFIYLSISTLDLPKFSHLLYCHLLLIELCRLYISHILSQQ